MQINKAVALYNLTHFKSRAHFKTLKKQKSNTSRAEKGLNFKIDICNQESRMANDILLRESGTVLIHVQLVRVCACARARVCVCSKGSDETA